MNPLVAKELMTDPSKLSLRAQEEVKAISQDKIRKMREKKPLLGPIWRGELEWNGMESGLESWGVGYGT